MLANARCIMGKVPEYCPPNCTIIVRAEPGTCDILPTMHCKLVNISDFVYILVGSLIIKIFCQQYFHYIKRPNFNCYTYKHYADMIESMPYSFMVHFADW